MLIPLNSNAPTEHAPWGTIGLICVNTAVFCATGFGSRDSIHDWGLDYHAGFQPIQWLTHNFMHLGAIHLVGNMLFLWTFGLIVEGRLGWWKFLATYLGLAVLQPAIEQLLMFWITDGITVGASGVIFALMAMSLVWAPESEINCIWIFGSRWLRSGGGAEVEISVLWMAIWYIGGNLLFACLGKLQLSSELLHSTGALLGFIAGTVMLKRGWVDCDGWDLFSVMTARHLRRSRKQQSPAGINANGLEYSKLRSSVESPEIAEAAARKRIEDRARFDDLLARRQGFRAWQLYKSAAERGGQWELSERNLLSIGELLVIENCHDEAVPLLEEYLRRFTARSVPVRLQLAKILVERQQRPCYALRILSALQTEGLSEKFMRLRAVIELEAQRLIQDGVLEIQTPDAL
jgi:membrane associated rhomboid family serine protease